MVIIQFQKHIKCFTGKFLPQFEMKQGAIIEVGVSPIGSLRQAHTHSLTPSALSITVLLAIQFAT